MKVPSGHTRNTDILWRRLVIFFWLFIILCFVLAFFLLLSINFHLLSFNFCMFLKTTVFNRRFILFSMTVFFYHFQSNCFTNQLLTVVVSPRIISYEWKTFFLRIIQQIQICLSLALLIHFRMAGIQWRTKMMILRSYFASSNHCLVHSTAKCVIDPCNPQKWTSKETDMIDYFFCEGEMSVHIIVNKFM